MPIGPVHAGSSLIPLLPELFIADSPQPTDHDWFQRFQVLTAQTRSYTSVPKKKPTQSDNNDQGLTTGKAIKTGLLSMLGMALLLLPLKSSIVNPASISNGSIILSPDGGLMLYGRDNKDLLIF